MSPFVQNPRLKVKVRPPTKVEWALSMEDWSSIGYLYQQKAGETCHRYQLGIARDAVTNTLTSDEI